MRSRTVFVVMALALLMSLTIGTATAAKPFRIPAWNDGEIVHFVVVSENVVDTENSANAAVLYAFGEPGNQPQADVLSAVPGDADYNPWWDVVFVVPLPGRDLTTNPFTSEEDILAAAAAGEVVLIETEFLFLCQVVR